MDLTNLRRAMADHSVTSLYAKVLAPNDNSKNQPYLGGDFSILTWLPASEPTAFPGDVRPNFKAKLQFAWLAEDGGICVAPHAKLILYPDYPEVRFSGYLKDCKRRPSAVMGKNRTPGRVLFLGVRPDRKIVGYAADVGSEIANELASLSNLDQQGVFRVVPLTPDDTPELRRISLLAELCRIHRLGWIGSKRLKKGELLACNATQCGGYTLEAELGIEANGRSDPDFLGWEVKGCGVKKFGGKLTSKPITLMTPEPTGGVYVSEGLVVFVDRYGYQSDKPGREMRRDFGGRHIAGKPSKRSNLTLVLSGFDAAKPSSMKPDGSVVLLGKDDEIAASWAFTDLMDHWGRKHALAAYVPYLTETKPTRQYRYGSDVRLASEPDFLKFLTAMGTGDLYYDPGIWYELVDDKIEQKKRSQFRMKSKNLGDLYASMQNVTVCDGDE